MNPRVVDFRRSPYDVYIGRPSVWGNPFPLKRDTKAGREHILRVYAQYLLENPALVEKMREELKGKVLGCFCAPRLCHGDLMVLVIDAEDPQEALRGFLGHSPQSEEDPLPSLF